MKILAIRLKNLASIPGPHCIDFTVAPLARAGLFAIVGPTGAGKSTLLDALCLAFFGRTPRLRSAPARGQLPDGDSDSLSINDPRTLLRRGTAHGYAEVDFVGADERRYCTRWEVRRARGKTGARLQPVEKSLRDLETGQVLANQAQEHSAQIEQTLGLSFDQFTRAVLLAQSEFASFLKADDKERADLLEKLTDSGRFSKISLRAFARAKEAEGAVKLLEGEAGAVKPLDSEVRAELTSQSLALQQARRELLAQEDAAQTLQRWWRSTLDLLQAVEAAEREMALQQAAHAERDADRQRLREILSAAPIRDGWRRLCDIKASLVPVAHARCEASATLVKAQAALIASEAAQALASSEFAAAKLQATLERPRHRQAADWEAELGVRREAATLREAELAELAHRHQRAAAAHSSAAADLDTSRSSLAALQRSIESLQPWAPLHAAWPAHRLMLNDLAKVLRRSNDLAAQAADLSSALTHAEARVVEFAAEVKLAEQRCATTLAALVKTADVANRLSALRAQLDEVRNERDRLLIRLNEWQRLQLAQIRVDEGHERIERLQSESEQSQARLAVAQSDSLRAEQALEQTSALIARLRRARSSEVQSLREHLQPGAECPVCGSVDHPFADAHKLIDALGSADEAELQSARDLFKAASTSLREAQATLASTNARSADARAAIEVAQAELADLAASLHDSPGSELPSEITKAIQQLERDRSGLDERLVNGRAQIEGFELQQRARDQCQKDRDQALAQLTRQQEVLSQAKLALQSAQSQQQRWQADTTQVANRLEELKQQLDQVLPPDYWQRLLAKPDAVLTEVATQVAALDRANLQQDQTRAALQVSQDRVQQCAQAQFEAHLRWQEADTKSAQLRLDDEHLRQSLADLLGTHASADAWSSAIEQATSLCAQALERSNLNLQQAQTDVRHGVENDTKTERDLDAAQQSLSRSEADVDAFLSQRPALTRDQLATLCVLTSDQIEAVRERVSAADGRLSEAATRLAERAAALQAQQDRHAPLRAALLVTEPESDEPLAAALAAFAVAMPQSAAESEAVLNLLDACRGAQQQCSLREDDVRIRLRQDDDCRQRVAALGDQLNAASAEHQRWAQISQVIGAHDGSVFRGIAQAYNLEVLLELANAHLAQLTRRYRLRRSGSDLGIFVVDGEMGDALRSVHSLSGGEGFLVSLSLALGLAAMSSHRLRIESLFIDEGFGVLDAQSLDVALEALDGLQALGRKVGVISHIPEMHERIGVQIQVRKTGPGTSALAVVG